MTASRSGPRLAALAAAVALPLVALPAAAEDVTVRDARGDMIKVDTRTSEYLERAKA